MELSVVILNYNVRHFLELCLKSVERAIENIDAEIIVVDNHSMDKSCAMVRSLFPNVKLIENQTNHGFSKGNNIGVNRAKGNYICILNPDTLVAEDTFETLLKFASNKSNLGILGCKLIDGTGKFLPESKRNVPSPMVSFKKILGNSKPYYAMDVPTNEIGKVEILVGAFMLLKKSLYEKLNGFDEDFFMYGEDMDFSYRSIKAGFDNYYNPETTIVHFKGESTHKDKTYAKHFNGAMRIFFKKHFKFNMISNTIISLGTRMLALIGNSENIESKKVQRHIFLTKSNDTDVASKFPFDVEITSQLDGIQPNTQIIFDSNSMTFKEIIHWMEQHENTDITFKILPPNARFLVGSDSSKNRGKVISF